MAVSFRIAVTNEKFVVRKIAQKDRELRARLEAATLEARQFLNDVLVAEAPHPKGRERQGHGVVVREPPATERFAGRLVGGLTAIDRTYTIEASLQSHSVAAYVEGGTGIYRTPEFGGPGSEWTERARGKSFAPFPGNAFGVGNPSQDPKFGQDVFAKEITVQGARPRPWVGRVYEETRDAIERIYENAVDRTI